MGNMTEESSQSTTEQVKERVQDVAQQAKGETREQLRDQVDTRSTQLGEQVRSTAQAVRRTSTQLREEGKETPAKLLEQVAERGERLGAYLTEADGNRILRDVEGVARRQPWVFAGGSAIVGFFASRFLKASSDRRYQEADGFSSSHGQVGNSGAALPPASPPATTEPAVTTGGASSGYGQ
jgi:gas vesicle protein